MCIYVFVQVRILLEVSCIYFTWNSSAQLQERKWCASLWFSGIYCHDGKKNNGIEIK